MPGIRQAVALLVLFSPSTLVAQNLIGDGDFESCVAGKAPDGWKPFHAGASPAVVVGAPGAAGSKQALVARPTRERGWVALSRKLGEPQDRLLVEFSFAFSSGSGRTFNFWSHEPDGKDASQINLCVAKGELRQYDGRTRTWVSISNRLKATTDLRQPVWHRLRIVAARDTGAIDFWLSAPGSVKLPSRPTATRHAYRTKLPFGAIDIVSGARLARGSFFLIDRLVVRGGHNVPRPSGQVPGPKTTAIAPGKPSPKTPAAKAAYLLDRVTVCAPDEKHKWNGCGAVTAAGGVVLYSWYTGGTGEPRPENRVEISRSFDGGRTWETPQIISDPPGPVRAADPMLWRDEKGTVHLTYALWDPAKHGKVGEWTFYHCTCVDPKGETLRWTEPVEVAPDRNLIVFFNNKPIRLESGEWLMPVVVRNGPPRGPYHWGFESAGALISRDGGKTWNLSGISPRIANSGYGQKDTYCWEAGAFQRKDGTVVIFVRNSWGLVQATESTDRGKTWNEFQPVNVPNPTARIHVRKLPTGEVICLSNPNARPGVQNRTPLAAFISYDDGVSFAKIVILDVKGPVMYPDAEMDEDGHTLHLHYESRREVYYASLDVRELLVPPRGYKR